jgi:membrane-associated phospholipid phosphatase
MFVFMKMRLAVLLVFIATIMHAQNFDINTLRQTNLNRNKNADGFFCTYSNAIAIPTVGVPITVYALGLIKKNKAMQIVGINMAISAGINGAFTYMAKQIVDRPRPAVSYPFLEPLESVTQYSFPSGHTSSSFNTATSLSIAYPKWYVIVPSYTYCSIMAYSRMHIGVHYPSDVFAGAILGVGSAYLSKFVTKKLQKNKHTSKMYNAVLF